MHKTIRSQLKSAFAIIMGGSSAWAGYSLWSGDERFYSEIVMPTVFQLFNPESAHRLAVSCCRWNLVPTLKLNTSECLRTSLCGRTLNQPVGLAAGFDKDAEGIEALFRLGFSTVEVGSVTPFPQPGNARPRLFRLLEDRAVINRYGFNSAGHEIVEERLKHCFNRFTPPTSALLGVNLGKNRDSVEFVEDYVKGVRRLGPFADYLVVNVSSPNTPGLRKLQGATELRQLLVSVRAEVDQLTVGDVSKRTCLLFVKLAPELVHWTEQEMDDVVQVLTAKESRVDGVIVANTMLERPVTLRSSLGCESGGLSGEPLEELSTRAVHRMYSATHGSLPIIGCGGVASGAAAFRKIAAGACAVQLYTALVYQGPPVLTRVCRELCQILEDEGFQSVREAVGSAHAKPLHTLD